MTVPMTVTSSTCRLPSAVHRYDTVGHETEETEAEGPPPLYVQVSDLYPLPAASS